MKTIVIAGGGRNVGKTTLAKRLENLLSGSLVVKLGHHPPKAEKPERYFLMDTPFCEILSELPERDFLILESGSVLDDPDLDADLVIFLPTADPKQGDKPGSAKRRARADIIRGEPLGDRLCQTLADRLGMDRELFSELLATVNS